MVSLRIAEFQIGVLKDLLAEVFAAFVGCVEAEEVVVCGGTQEVVDEGTPVTAETGCVAHNTLGIKSDDKTHKEWIPFKTCCATCVACSSVSS